MKKLLLIISLLVVCPNICFGQASLQDSIMIGFIEQYNADSIGVVVYSDTHGDAGEDELSFFQFADYIYNISVPATLTDCPQTVIPRAVLVNGDICATDGNGVINEQLVTLNSVYSCPVYPNLGNHDGNYYGFDSVNELYGDNGDPYSTAKSKYPELFSGRTYYKLDLGPIRFLFLNNNVDTTIYYADTDHVYRQSYPFSNNPGKTTYYWQNLDIADPIGELDFPSGNPDGTNDDTYGFGTRGSAQWLWAMEMAKNVTYGKKITWVVPLMHRSIIAPYDAAVSQPTRPCMRYSGLVNDLIEHRNVRLILQADIHIQSFIGPIKWVSGTSPETAVWEKSYMGAYFLNTRTDYVPRLIDDTQVPTGSILTSFSNPPYNNTYNFVTYLIFYKNVCRVQIFMYNETSDELTRVYNDYIINSKL